MEYRFRLYARSIYYSKLEKVYQQIAGNTIANRHFLPNIQCCRHDEKSGCEKIATAVLAAAFLPFAPTCSAAAGAFKEG